MVDPSRESTARAICASVLKINPQDTLQVWRGQLRERGFAGAAAASVGARLQIDTQDWRSFAASWGELEPDRYMADGGRYRRRRFAVATLTGSQLTPEPHQPHFQSRDANPLNGGIDRWFAPIPPALLVTGPLAAIVDLCRETFALTDAPAPPAWRVEFHQFRIEARAAQPGLPTPEGVHRDGVDWAFVMLIGRENTAGGVTTLFDTARHPLGSFTLAEPMQSVFIDDHRIFHGVTPIHALEATRPAFRDVLVITFTRGRR
jgi:hypothetical protein